MIVTREEFIAYLSETLIPDLHESERWSMAADLAASVEFMKDHAVSKVRIDSDDGEGTAETVDNYATPTVEEVAEEVRFFSFLLNRAVQEWCPEEQRRFTGFMTMLQISPYALKDEESKDATS